MVGDWLFILSIDHRKIAIITAILHTVLPSFISSVLFSLKLCSHRTEEPKGPRRAVCGFVFIQQSSESTKWTEVRIGDTVNLGCNISYHTETIWMRQNIDRIPTVVLISGPNYHDGRVFSKKTLSPRFTAVPNARDQTNQLRITNVTDTDLALYYCVGRIRGTPEFGIGTRLHCVFENKTYDSEPQETIQGSSSLFDSPSFYTLYAFLLCLGQVEVSALSSEGIRKHVAFGGSFREGIASSGLARVGQQWMMGNRTISSIALCLLVIPSVSPPVPSPAIVKGTFGDSVTLPCDGSAYVKSEDQLDVLWQTDGGKKVARFSRGVHSVGSHFTKRVTFLTEDIKRGKFSITISSIAFSDEGAYECVWRSQEEDEEVLNDVKLDVIEPPFSKFLSVPAGESVTLQCYVHVNKQASDEVVVQWKRGDEPVLNVSLGEVTNGRMYAERATVSPDRIQKGNFSLSLNITGLCDSGDYWCFTDKNQRGTPVTLKIEDYEHFHTVTLSLEMAFHLSLPGEPVKVNFSKEVKPNVSRRGQQWMMGIRTISSIALCLLVIPSVSPPVLSPAIVKGTFVDSVTLPCDGSAYVKSEDQLDVLWQTDGGKKKVARFSRGVHSVGSHFTKRVTFLTEDIKRGKFSITISSIAFSDEGAYECVWRSQEEDEKVLNDVKLDVMEPPFSKFLSVPAGESVTLQCYVHVNKQASDEVVVQWKRGDEPVLNVSLGEVTNGPMYEERATVSPKRIQKGNFSLSLNITGLCDSGDYWCFTDKNQRGTPVTLKIEEYGHFDTVTLSLGMAFHLSLPGEPVKRPAVDHGNQCHFILVLVR
ncbi:hypothetical protein SKAU_G00429960 [Synaphobranchus kaupii]|uniref:Ig-like domain-containing protein n=1 Tax=Synaphobranchus kaupii TaxID=118154 RepID=A0A9Q1E4G4_SYNKA|nr:hypothetical protein SKAU_G00429960 [Synaphobranchus kaupii]